MRNKRTYLAFLPQALFPRARQTVGVQSPVSGIVHESVSFPQFQLRSLNYCVVRENFNFLLFRGTVPNASVFSCRVCLALLWKSSQLIFARLTRCAQRPCSFGLLCSLHPLRVTSRTHPIPCRCSVVDTAIYSVFAKCCRSRTLTCLPGFRATCAWPKPSQRERARRRSSRSRRLLQHTRNSSARVAAESAPLLTHLLTLISPTLKQEQVSAL